MKALFLSLLSFLLGIVSCSASSPALPSAPPHIMQRYYKKDMDLEERRLQFTLYPEGGSLVAGVENRVAFEATWNVKLCSAPGPDRRKTARCCGMNSGKIKGAVVVVLHLKSTGEL